MSRLRLPASVFLVLLALLAGADAARAAPPGAPAGLQAIGGSGWRTGSEFKITWNDPVEQGTGLRWMRYELLEQPGDTFAGEGSVSVTGGPNLATIAVPSSGAFRLDVRLEDGSGQSGPVSSVILRRDDLRPGNVTLGTPDGWISEEELPYPQTMEARSRGPSGLAGFAVTIADREDTRPCPSGSCIPSQITVAGDAERATFGIAGLAEGAHWISAVAVSGAGLASAVPVSQRLRVDRTPPVTRLSGVPEGWTNEPVSIEVAASDAASGMDARPGTDDGEPVTVIQAEGQEARVSRGRSAALRVSTEGVTRVRYWARDLAGNVNDGGLRANGTVRDLPGEATIRIDRRAPVVEIEPERDRDEPEMLVARVTDPGSGTATGELSYRRLPGGDPVPLPTSLDGEELSARIPSDGLPAGRYEIRAWATDRAGNRGDSIDVATPTVLELPLKAEVKLTLRLRDGAGKPSWARSGGRRAAIVAGRITAADGNPMPGATVTVEQTFDRGASRRNIRRLVRADGSGGFTARIADGPSRTVTARYGGDPVNRAAASGGVRLIARDRITFRTSPALLLNGGTAVMSGRVRGRGAAQPAGGKLVAIQYFDPSRGRWRPVEVIRADGRGRFRYRYRFRTISYAQKILFRAVSLPESGWPFRTTASKRLGVVVYPRR